LIDASSSRKLISVGQAKDRPILAKIYNKTVVAECFLFSNMRKFVEAIVPNSVKFVQSTVS